MGKISDSLKREVGKNAGKFVSNVIFGDRHSTPYRRVESPHRQREIELRDEARREKNRILATSALSKMQMERKHQLNNLDAAVLQAVEKLNAQSIPQCEPELVDYMQKLTIQLNATPYNKDKVEGPYHNKFLYALLEKYNQGIMTLKMVAPANPLLPYFEDSLRKKQSATRMSRFKTYFSNHWLLVTIISIAVIVCYVVFMAFLSATAKWAFALFMLATICGGVYLLTKLFSGPLSRKR